MKKTRWLSRQFITGPFLCLVRSEKAYMRAFDHLKIPVLDRPKWLSGSGNARCTPVNSSSGNGTCIVSLRVDKSYSLAQVHALLVHEAVHVFQHHAEAIGEDRPSAEFQAYSIQHIAQELFTEYERQTRARVPKKSKG